jgi:hypothetical protein
MRATKNLSIIIFCCAFIGCANNAPKNAQTATDLKWTAEELEGSTWQLIDDSRIENMSFYPNGFLPITLGVKTTSGSTIRAPIYRWAIADDGALVITDNKNNTVEKLYKVEADDRRVAVKLNGRVQVYDKLK